MKKNEMIFKQEYQQYAICIEDLSFSYGEKEDVSLSLKIKKGEKVCLLGHNGSGKSTLLKLIDGLLVPKSGNIYINGYLLDDNSSYFLRRDIGLLFQNPDSQFVGTTVKDDLIFSLENENVDPSIMDELIDESLKEVDMLDYKNREPVSLSGGQKQRVNLASMFILKKNILLFDEAKSMLDPKGKADMERILEKKIEENENLTIIDVTHDIEDTSIFNRAIVLNSGKIIYDGDKISLFKDREKLTKYKIKPPFLYEFLSYFKDKNTDNIDDISSLKEFLCQLK